MFEAKITVTFHLAVLYIVSDMPINQPNSKYDHLFVVLRYDTFCHNQNESAEFHPDSISGIKAYLTQDEADKECERLNELQQRRLTLRISQGLLTPDDTENPDFYFVSLVRIAKGLLNHLPDAK